MFVLSCRSPATSGDPCISTSDRMVNGMVYVLCWVDPETFSANASRFADIGADARCTT